MLKPMTAPLPSTLCINKLTFMGFHDRPTVVSVDAFSSATELGTMGWSLNDDFTRQFSPQILARYRHQCLLDQGTRAVTCVPPRIHGPFGFSLAGGTIFVPIRAYMASTLPSGFDVVAPGTQQSHKHRTK